MRPMIAVALAIAGVCAPLYGAQAQSWVKLCPPTAKGKILCLTQHDRIDAATGNTLVFASVIRADGKPNATLEIKVADVAKEPGFQVAFYSREDWQRINQGQKIDDTKNQPLRLPINGCTGGQCRAETSITPDVLRQFQTSEGMVIYAIKSDGAVVAYPVPLADFKAADSGRPLDYAQFKAARDNLMATIQRNQKPPGKAP